MSLLSGSINPSNTEMGHNQDENQVSSASSSCVKSFKESASLPDFSLAKIKAASALTATTKSFSASPVSYTHLDVYKRQTYGWMLFAYFYLGKRQIKKHNSKIDTMIEDLKELENQFE